MDNTYNYIINPYNKIILLNGFSITSSVIETVVKNTNEEFKKYIDTCPIIAMESNQGSAMSSLIGSVFNHFLIEESNGCLVKNPCSVGNPDILNISFEDAKSYYDYHNNEKDYSKFGFNKGTYPYGGIETKCSQKGMNWSAHHRENNNLLGIIWDYVNNYPQIITVMFSYLIKEDWKDINDIQDTKNTNSCKLTSEGKEKMKKGWLCILDDLKYICKYDLKFNDGKNIIDI